MGKENILITGSRGFIGTHLCRGLIREGYTVLELTDDIRNINIISAPIVIHLAAILPQNSNDPFLLFDINARGTLKLLEAAHRGGVKQFIYASTMSVYSEPQYLPVDEKHPTHPTTIYGASKLAGEVMCGAYSNLMDITILRYGGAYGEGQHEHTAMYKFTAQAKKNEPITIYGDGSQTSDFTHIGDIVRGTILAIGKKPGIYNIGSGKETSVKELAEKIIKNTKSKSEIVFQDKTDRPFRFYMDITKAKNELEL